MISFLISLLVFILPSSVAGKLDNEHLSLAQYAYESAITEKIDPDKFLALINCESNWAINAKGDYRLEEDKFMAKGILQFWQGTFDAYAKKYKLVGEYENPRSQILLASVIIGREKNGWNHWRNCSKKLGIL